MLILLNHIFEDTCFNCYIIGLKSILEYILYYHMYSKILNPLNKTVSQVAEKWKVLSLREKCLGQQFGFRLVFNSAPTLGAIFQI